MNRISRPGALSTILICVLSLCGLHLLQADPGPVHHLINTAGAVGEPWFEAYDGVVVESLSDPAPASLQSLMRYHHGQPTDYEQLMLEMINRARANPGAEAARLGIALNEGLEPGAIEDTPKAPLALHPLLTAAAREHSQWMLDTNTFSHTGEGGSSPSVRIQAAGYVLQSPWSTGENISWGGSASSIDPEAETMKRHNGLFTSPGHRLNICNARFDEIGAGLVPGRFTSGENEFNALMVTQKYASSAATPSPFLVGAVYYDFDGDGFYSVGEGIEGIEIQLQGGSWYTETSSAGGYTLPMPISADARDVSFTGPGLDETVTVAFPGSVNHKVDLVLHYVAPSLSGPAAPVAGVPNNYLIDTVPGATRFHVTTVTLEPAPDDGANDLDRVIDGTSSEYSALSGTVRYEGVASYRFAHPEGFGDETLTYAAEFLAGPGARIHFRSRLGWASPNQEARVEVSSDSGSSWQAVYTQSGTSSSGETSFHARSVSLDAWAGEVLRIRFNYRLQGGSHYPQISDGVGWYVDAIHFIDLRVLNPLNTDTVAYGESYSFVPPEEGIFHLTVQPENHGRLWAAGPLLEVDAVALSGYADWAARWEQVGSLAADTLALNPAGDYSGDGVSNLLASALGLNPLVPAAHDLPGWRIAGSGISYTYTRDSGVSGIDLVPQLSTNLSNWYAFDAPALGFAVVDELVSNDGSLESRRLFFPNGLPPSVYARVKASLDP